MDPRWSKEGTSSARCEVSSEEELLRLISLRDFISLLLSYPVKLEEEEVLKAWIDAFPEWRAQLFSRRVFSTDDDALIAKPWYVLTKKALSYMRGLVPTELLGKIERGQRSIFNYEDAAAPEAILDLTVDLAVGQLIHTLFSRDDHAYQACYVRMTTRNFKEKNYVRSKIAGALEERHKEFGVEKDLHRVLWIDFSKYESDAQARIQEQINAMMVGVVAEGNSMIRPLVIVKGDPDGKLDLGKVCIPAGVVLLWITTELSSQSQVDEFTNTWTVDSNIRTLDHLLPWQVFCSYARINMAHSSGAFQRIAVQIVEECRGHLLAIVLLAKYLKYVKDVKQWELALSKLSYTNPSSGYQESYPFGISSVMVNAFVNIIWEEIGMEGRFYLEASLFVHNIKNGVPREILLSEWYASSQEVLLKTGPRFYITVLLDRSVLLNRESNNVYLPIEWNDIIKSLHTLNPSIIKQGKLGLTEIPYIGRWHGLVKIELMDKKICELPESPDCPKLRQLLLQGNVELMDIPHSFFNHMPLLQYLDLSNTSIRYLPPSISKLTELKKFYLRTCELFAELPPTIGKLKQLQELDLDETFITHLPEEIRELINLRRLILCFDQDLCYDKEGNPISSSTIIPQGAISKLTLLNYLSIDVDPEDERWKENVINILVEIF